jgi:hypothetical protein
MVEVKEGLQDGITEVLLVVGTKLGVQQQNGIITEDLVEAGIIVEVLQADGIRGEVLQGDGIAVGVHMVVVGITEEVLLGVGITEEILLEVGIAEGVLLEVGITEGVLLEAGIIVGVHLEPGIVEMVLLVVSIIEGAPLEAGKTEEDPGIFGEILPVVGIIEDIPPEDGTVEEVLAGGTIVEVLAREALEVVDGKKEDPLRWEDGTIEEVEEGGRPVGVALDGTTEDQTGVLAATEVRDGSLEVAAGGWMDQTGVGIAVAEGEHRAAGVMTRGTHQGGTTVEVAEEGIGAVGVAETGVEILFHQEEEAGEIAGELQFLAFISYQGIQSDFAD